MHEMDKLTCNKLSLLLPGEDYDALERSSFIRTNFIRSNNNSLSVPNTFFDDEALPMIINKLLLCRYVLTYLLFGDMVILDRSNKGFLPPQQFG